MAPNSTPASEAPPDDPLDMAQPDPASEPPLSFTTSPSSSLITPVAATEADPNTEAHHPEAITYPALRPHPHSNDDVPDEASILRDFTENVRDQGDLDNDIIAHAEAAILEDEDNRDQQRIRKLEDKKVVLNNKVRALRDKRDNAIGCGARDRSQDIQRRIDDVVGRIRVCDEEISAFELRIQTRHQQDHATTAQGHGSARLPDETTRAFLIRTGKITPFTNIADKPPPGVEGELAQAIVDAEAVSAADQLAAAEGSEFQSHQNLRKPGFDLDVSEHTSAAAEVQSEFSLRPRKKRKVAHKARRDAEPSGDEFQPTGEDDYVASPSPSGPSGTTSELSDTDAPRRRKARKTAKGQEERVELAHIDDGNELVYQARLNDWVGRRSKARHQHVEAEADNADGAVDTGREVEEWFKPHPQIPDLDLGGGLKLPGDIHQVLFNYQKTGVQWMCELYSQRVGGILGDEMGLGKTVQAVSLLAALHYSKKLHNPALVVVPATLMRQWVTEFHQWWPVLRVSILHSSGSGMVDVAKESRIEDEDAEYDEDERGSKRSKAARAIIDRVKEQGHVLITTYAGMQTYSSLLSEVDWSYAILDEGHKIRNPNTAVTITCKMLKTPHRLILSGTPMQNSLTELWSIFDFVYPFRLGTLWSFRDQFEIPIKQGGYASSSNLQIMAAQKCAEVLKEIVAPFLLQRVKADVAQDLPKKSEQVLFCKFTDTQRTIYEAWLRSDQRDLIFQQKMKALVGIDTLRKICNHPDLTRKNKELSYGKEYGDPELSGKMLVVKGLVTMWKRLGHKCLVFCQGVQVLDILEKMIKGMDDTKFLRMDGRTPVKDRQRLVDWFNNDGKVDLFLLTTRVGGLGLNLTGASRVIIFDPDWNPSTDSQAQERAWRLGQKKDVQIFRLLTAGTIEEKIYQRQIFKTVLTNKVLKDPTQRSSFQIGDLEDLFSLGPTKEDGQTETGSLFKGSERKIRRRTQPQQQPDASRRPNSRSITTNATSNPNPNPNIDDVDDIAGVTAHESYKDNNETPATKEERIMEGIFSRSGVTSTLKHEHVINGRKVTANGSILEREANEIAARARAGARKCKDVADGVVAGTVTWTGEFGSSGYPGGNGRRGRGVGSASLLGHSASGSGPASGSGVGFGGGSGAGGGAGSVGSLGDLGGPRPGGLMRKKDFLPMLKTFIERHGNRTPSKALVDHFSPYCPNKRQTDLFKAALDDVAVLEQVKVASSLRGFWRLRTRDDR